MKTSRSVAVALTCGVLVLFGLCCLHATGQGLFGTISGSVTDTSGAVIPGATVNITNVNTKVTIRVATNASGVYSVTSLNPGVYTVQAEATGFKSAVVSAVPLEVNANPKVDLTLQVGSSSQTVDVTAEAPILTTQQSDLGQTVGGRQLDQLPVFSGSGRNVYSLIPLSAGVSQQVGAGGADNDNLRINGDRPRFHEYLLDGTSIGQPVFGGQAISPSVDSIQEFRIATNSMSAEYGNSGGGVLIAVTKTGGNQFHGSAYEYNRNEAMDARNFFEDSTKPKNPFNYNEFGGTIGGPIVRNKLFFFGDYQGVRQHGDSAVTGALVPDAAFRNGDLSALCGPGFDASGNCLDPKGQIFFPGKKVAVPFNKIPSDQISPISQKFLALYPTSSVAARVPGTALLNYNSPSSSNVNRYNPRIDYNFSQADHLFGVFHRETSAGTSYSIVTGPAGETTYRGDTAALTVGWTHTFSGTTLNDFRFGYLSRIADRAGYGQGYVSPADFGISGIPGCLSSTPHTEGGTKCGTPDVGINGYTSPGAGEMLYEPAKTLQFTNTVTKIIGRHSLKVGGEARHYTIDNYQPSFPNGSFGFKGEQTGHPFADFLFGSLNTGSNVSIQNAMLASRAWAYALFIQDDFKVTRKLTLNLGLRYQLDKSFHEEHNGIAFFNPFNATWEQFGVNAPSTPFDAYQGWGPRVGFAYNAVSTFVVRGGFGIMYPGPIGHGKAGDAQPGPLITAGTQFPAGTNWGSLTPVRNPDPSQITAPIPLTGDYINWSVWAPRNQTPSYVETWNLTLEKQFGANTVAQLSYAGSHGLHLPINYDYNMCQQSRESVLQHGWDATTSPYCSPVAAQAAGIWNLYVNPAWWGLSNSIYHSMQARVDKRFSHGFSVLANFTWSKLIDDSSSDWGGWGGNDVLGQDFYNRRSERSVSAGDIPLRFTVAPIVELPFGPGRKWLQNGLASQVIGGWRASAIYTASSGFPFGITDNSYGYCNAAHTISNRPNMIGDPLPSGFNQTLQQWFNVKAFDFSGTCPASNLVALTGGYDTTKAFGDAPRYFSSVRSPGLNNLDFSLQKDFKVPLGEQTRLTFQADAFNALNHPQFASPVSDPTNSNFGVIQSTSKNNRILQLGLHLYF